TTTCAPAASSPGIRRWATCPPPTTSTRRPDSRRPEGYGGWSVTSPSSSGGRGLDGLDRRTRPPRGRGLDGLDQRTRPPRGRGLDRLDRRTRPPRARGLDGLDRR